MKLNEFQLHIKEGQEDIKGYVILNHNTQYTLTLANHGELPCDAEVYIDNIVVGNWRIRPFTKTVIERPSNDTGRFTFYKEGTKEAEKAQIASDKNMGLISVIFRPGIEPEKRVTFTMDAYTRVVGSDKYRGGTGLSGSSKQTFKTVKPLEYSKEKECTINIRLCASKENQDPRPLRKSSTPIPPALK